MESVSGVRFIASTKHAAKPLTSDNCPYLYTHIYVVDFGAKTDATYRNEKPNR